MINPIILSLALPYVQDERQWILLAACTNKALSSHLDLVEHHWDTRYKQLIAELRSGHARFEIRRYVRCGSTELFHWERGAELGVSTFFTVSVIEPSRRSFARQAVPQVKQALNIMAKWNASSEADAVYTAKKRKHYHKTPPPRACRATHHLGCIPIRVATTPSPLLHGDLQALNERMKRSWSYNGYSTDESWEWECECGASYESHRLSL
jgi:hypothetical protein